jgi:uncharacterized protein involved in oxidation of intracellular sulfur
MLKKKRYLIIINDAPYGTEKAFNALRLAMQIQKDYDEANVLVFLMADAVTCALSNQKTPDGYYNIERMMRSILLNKGEIKLCGGCANARGLNKLQLIDGTKISTMAELTQWVIESEKVISF